VKQARQFIYVSFAPVYKFTADKAVPAKLPFKDLFIAFVKPP